VPQQKSLAVLASQRSAHFKFALRFDPLGNDLDVPVGRQIADTADDVLAARRLIDIPDQAHVNLDEVGRRIGEDGQPRLAHSKIVER